ncbi:HD-GYP domain-containing protein [Clostridiisalibacter paucivorans]|uniref:HD-GYP domain-containing protein n=1 Tax=Clostridiisalibacter paucivorans TaxID=408753 RepID=UPI000478F51E|nr:HD domain-containing phosphohydrolase [Clostridiisalibacter paucivorans]
MKNNLLGIKVPIDKCTSGMKVISDVKDEFGFILTVSGTILNEKIIERLKNRGIESVLIHNKDVEGIFDLLDDESEDVNFMNIEIKPSTPEIDIESNSVYKSSLRIMDKIMDQVKDSGKLDVKKVKGIMVPLFNEIVSKNNILYCLEILKNKSVSSYSHSVNVAILSGLLGKWMELDKMQILNLIEGGLLHDIGKYKMPINIINKKEYTESDMKLLEKHPILGYKFVLRMKDISIDVKKIILGHHENCDGTGYPFGIIREQMSLETRIISVVDRFDNIYARNNNDSDNINIFTALERLYKEEFTKLDYQPLEIFVRNMLWNHIGRYIYLNDDRIGEVVFINNMAKFKPLIRVDEGIIDLSSEDKVKINKIIQ